MSISFFPDKDHQPSTDELRAALGSKQSLWKMLTQFISDNYQIPGELSFGGKNYGWNFLKLRKKVGRVLRETPQLHDGRWLFVSVTSETDVQDVEQLLQVKKRPMRQTTQKG